MKWVVLIMLFLTGCLGPELITLGGIKVTAGTVITVPHKIEAYEKYKEQKKQEELKKRFEVNKIDERTFEIYY
jgi:hypothetical protein